MIKRFGYIKIVLLACVLFQGCAKKLPKVLIIGDSISGGYFPFVEEQLEGKVILTQAVSLDEKGEYTATGVKQEG